MQSPVIPLMQALIYLAYLRGMRSVNDPLRSRMALPLRGMSCRRPMRKPHAQLLARTYVVNAWRTSFVDDADMGHAAMVQAIPMAWALMQSVLSDV